MLESEIAHRDGAKRARLLRQARFPVPKSVEGFDWSNVAFPDGWGRDEMLSLAFVRDAEDLVFYGQTGRGKTHMATALGIAATSAGYPVRFWQTAQLVLQLGEAKREGTLDRLLADVTKARLLVLDEFGYVPFDVDGARLLYHCRGSFPCGCRKAARRWRAPIRPEACWCTARRGPCGIWRCPPRILAIWRIPAPPPRCRRSCARRATSPPPCGC